jgi:hypothetical protein
MLIHELQAFTLPGREQLERIGGRGGLRAHNGGL